LGKRALQMQPLQLEEVVEDALRMILPDARRRGIFIDRRPSPPLPVIRGDRVHLQQVLLNLMLNGMDAMAEIELPDRRLTVRTVMLERSVELAVTDCGHGIPEDKLAVIFDSFVTTKENGMGLGLAMARSVAEAHAGRITAENNVDGGATFRLFLPVAAEKAGAP
jgi:signal transduction histidine kinase